MCLVFLTLNVSVALDVIPKNIFHFQNFKNEIKSDMSSLYEIERGGLWTFKSALCIKFQELRIPEKSHVIKRSFWFIVIIVDNMTQCPSTTFHRRPTFKGKLMSYMLDRLNWLHFHVFKESRYYVATVLYLRPSEFVQIESYRSAASKILYSH